MIGSGTGQQHRYGVQPGKTPGPFKGALRVAIIYLIIGSLWIVFSDKILSFITHDAQLIESISIFKGILYVVVTALVIFALVRNALRGEAVYSARLDDSYARLQETFEAMNTSRNSLAESEEQYRLLFNALLSGYCVHEIIRDKNGAPRGIRTLNTNPAFAAIAGIAEGESSEDGFMRLLPGDSQAWLDSFGGVVATGNAMHFEVHTQNTFKELEITVFRPATDRFAAIINDISDRKLMERAFDAESEQLKVTLDSIGDGVIAIDTEGKISMLNGVAGHLMGIRRAEAAGMPIGRALELYGGASGSKFASRITTAIERGDMSVFKAELRIKSKDGAEKLLSGRASPMKGSDRALQGFVVVFRDVTEQQQKEAEILYLSYHDLLTGLYNRNFFEEELRRLDTERQLPLSIIMGDANNLKLVNDVFGHREGDELLRAMAQVLRDSCRTEDIISRWGGDEFTILLPRTDADHAAMICRRIQAKCRECHTADRQLHPSISLGFDTKSESGTEIVHIIKAAEDMMYKNKLLDSRTAHNDFLQAMRSRIGENDLESERHIGRLSELCVRTGRELNLRDSDLADLRILALLHDIGKAAIDPRIINKPGDLTQEEWEEIKRHSSIGYRIVRSAPELMLVADYILGHHERWDGEGYPQGLKGEHIPLASRILAVADAYDVMTQGRPYRLPLNQETALMEIFRNAGTQFDPDVVVAFASVLNNLTDELKS